MKTHDHPSERGQAIVLIILAIVGVFGFAALAVDMGQIYAARRNAQNAADAAALSAAYDAIAGSKNKASAISKGFAIAEVNGFNNDKTTNEVEVNNPPTGGGPYCFECTDDPRAKEYFQVKITVHLNPIFAQLVYKGAEVTTVEAIAHASTPDTVSSGDALHALSKADDAMEFDGTVGVEIHGGNIRSNGGMIKNGNGNADSEISADAPGKIYYATTFSGKTGKLSPGPTKAAAEFVANMTPPACPTPAEAKTWTPGSGFWTKNINGVNYYYYDNGLSVEALPKGIHCIDGGIGKGNYTGKGVLLVLLSGGIQQTGNDSVNLRAAPDLKDRNGTQWGGMVFYAPPSNTEVLKFGGNSGAYFQGTIFAPGATCDIGGTADGTAIHTSVVCNNVKTHGNSTLKIVYNPPELFHFPPAVELVQ